MQLLLLRRDYRLGGLHLVRNRGRRGRFRRFWHWPVKTAISLRRQRFMSEILWELRELRS